MEDDCRSVGRDPADVRRSVLLFETLDPWLTGVQDFVLFWPSVDREDALTDVLARLR